MNEKYDIAILGGEQEVIHEHAYPHAAVGCLEQPVEEQDAGFVRLPDEILDINGGGGVIREGQAPVHGIVVAHQEHEGGLIRPVLGGRIGGDQR